MYKTDFSKDSGILVGANATAIYHCMIVWADEGSKSSTFMETSAMQVYWSTIEGEAFTFIFVLKKFRPWFIMFSQWRTDRGGGRGSESPWAALTKEAAFGRMKKNRRKTKKKTKKKKEKDNYNCLPSIL